MIFDTWSGLARVLLVGVVAYVALVIILRLSWRWVRPWQLSF
jgi:hypothetical protein